MNQVKSVNKTLKIFARNFDLNGNVIIESVRFHDIIKNAFLAGLADGFERAEGRASGDNYLVLEPLDQDDKELSWECFLSEMEDEDWEDWEGGKNE